MTKMNQYASMMIKMPGALRHIKPRQNHPRIGERVVVARGRASGSSDAAAACKNRREPSSPRSSGGVGVGTLSWSSSARMSQQPPGCGSSFVHRTDANNFIIADGHRNFGTCAMTRMTTTAAASAAAASASQRITNNNPSSFASDASSSAAATTTTAAAAGGGRRRGMSSSSDEIRLGTDLLADSLAHGSRRKIVLESYAPSGVDVKGMVRAGDGDAFDEGVVAGDDVVVHMHGSVMAFPDACFLWDVRTPQDVNLESLSAARMYAPAVEYLFIGCEGRGVPHGEMEKIKKEFRRRGVVVDQMDIMNAMGTFNILNGEDRRVACVLVIDPDDES